MTMFLTKQRILCWLLLGLIILATCIGGFMQPKTERMLLFFQSKLDGSVKAEERYVMPVSDQEPAITLVSELLLGPMNRSFFRFTDPDITPNACFVRSGCLYVDLPAAALTPKIQTAEFSVFHELLKRAVFTNYPHIRTIALSIDGRSTSERSH
ncbi:MAG: GerMN domain-containing protein [Treponema sp.]